MRTISFAALLVSLLGLLACGNYMRIDRYTDAELAVPTEMAIKSTVLGLRSFRLHHGVEALCIGQVRPANTVERDVEARQAREAWELELTAMVRGAAPRVHPARECLLTGEGEIVTYGDSVPAMMVRVSIPRVVDHRTEPQVYVSVHQRRINRSGSVGYKLLRDEDGWWLDRTECFTNTICNRFDYGAVIWGMPNDGSGPRSAAALQARRRTLQDSIRAARAAADTSGRGG